MVRIMTKVYIKQAQPRTQAEDKETSRLVAEIIHKVRTVGDAALKTYAQQFDQVDLTELRISEDEIQRAERNLPESLKADIRFGIERIKAFAQAQLGSMVEFEQEMLPGLNLGQRLIPIETVGVYVPGGRYPLLSSAQMGIIPARVAGVKTVRVCTPTNKEGRIHEAVLFAAAASGADEIYGVGGAQAIAAMAYGTQSIGAVDKLVGPGNRFVTEAKRQVMGQVGIDLLAGPSEVLIIADATAKSAYLAADLLAQAEHDVDARAILVCTDQAVAQATLVEVERQLATLATAKVARPSWDRNGEIIVVDTLAEAVQVSDQIAPEHLEVHTADSRSLLPQLKNYGSLFLGEEAAVIFADKVAGTNHTLPTLGAARYTGGVWAGTFLKVVTYQWLTASGVEAVGPVSVRQSAKEGLEGHRRSAALRLGEQVQ